MEDGRLPLEDNSVDVAFMGLLIHHQHYDEATPDERPARAQALFDEVYRVLKPGGTFGVTEHTAVAGASRAQSATSRWPL